jgi:hypothetical protein
MKRLATNTHAQAFSSQWQQQRVEQAFSEYAAAAAALISS